MLSTRVYISEQTVGRGFKKSKTTEWTECSTHTPHYFNVNGDVPRARWSGLTDASTLFFAVAQYLAQSESLCLHHIFVVTHDMLVLLRGSSEALRTDLAAVRVVLCVNGNHVALETRRVAGTVVAVLALVNPPFFLSFANNYSHAAG